MTEHAKLTLCRLKCFLKTGTLAKSDDPDEMPQTAAFHQGLHCFLRQKKRLSEEKM